MTVREWLERGQAIETEIAELNKACKSAWETVTSISPNMNPDKVMSSGESDSKLVNFVSYVEELEKIKNKLFATKLEIISYIYKLNDKRLRIVLVAKFVNNKTDDEIEADIGLCKSTINKTLGTALVNIKELLLKDGLL